MDAPSAGWSPGRLAWCSAAKVFGLFLLILGSQFLVLQMCSSPLPVFDQWPAEGQHLLQPWLHGQLHIGDLFAPWAQHRIVWTRLLTLGLFEINGQWDTQVEAIAAAGLHAGTAALLAIILVRCLGREREDAILLCLVLLFGLPFAQEDTLSGGFASQYYTLLLFGVVAIWGMASHRPGTAGWWIGAVSAVLAWFSVATGGLPALAVAAWMGLRLARRDGRPRENWLTLGVALALGAGGLCLSIGVGQQGALEPRSPGELLIRFAGLLAWPNPTAWAAPMAYAPFACLLWRWVRGRQAGSGQSGAAEAFLIPLGLFTLLNTAALAYARNRYGTVAVSRYMDFLAFGAVVNFGCLLLLRREMKNAAPGVRAGCALLTALWVAGAGFGLSRLTAGNIAQDLEFVRGCSQSEVENVAAFVRRPDLRGFLSKDPFAIQCQQPAVAAGLLQDPEMRQILPWQVRMPVIIEGASGSGSVHKVAADPHDPSQGGWLLERGQDKRAAYFRSATIRGLRLPYLRFPAVSALGDDALLALVDEHSGNVSWVRDQPGRSGWQSVLVRTPAGPFHVEAVLSGGPGRQLAFSFPREVGALSAWVDTLLDGAVGFLFAGAGVWLGAIFWGRLVPADESPEGIRRLTSGGRYEKDRAMTFRQTVTTTMLALLAAAALAAPARAQEKSPAPADAKPQASAQPSGEDMMAMSQPGENQKLLVYLVGDWTYHIKFWMIPGAPASESTGSSNCKPLMDGRYFLTNTAGKFAMPGADGQMQDVDFKGMSIDGYDNVKKKFVSSWIDNMGTGILASEGTYDPSTKTFTYHSEEETMPGVKTKQRQVTKILDHDHYVLEMYDDSGDKETKIMEITYTRHG